MSPVATVPIREAAKRLGVGFGVGALARLAVVAGESVAVFAELAASGLAGSAHHSGQP